jgi:Flp pilus assembly protein TadG
MAVLPRERGASLVEFGLMLPFLTLLLMGVIDMGRAFYWSIEVTEAAHTGALYGTQNISDRTGMQNAALADAHDVPGMTATASYGCECSGTANASVCPASLSNSCSNPTCTYNVVNLVQVCTKATYTPLFPWTGIPSSITMTGAAALRAGE